ncbi:MAG: hypothetical protein DRR06_00805 [Gammaproteobacteria bacterium]|nr:MAG: hypothetical protein DRR06_00805 [Gammaproteobacteria bacterium]RLA51438.1 MAG: hypothetical protein DRR42_10405 [Gammaproteobacteria bacterium]
MANPVIAPVIVKNGKRLTSIDMLRGLVIVIMALDHVRDMLGAPSVRPMEWADADASLFFTRWITHLCAPTFVLLAGTSAFLYGASGRTNGDISRFLLTRGIWLVFVELTLVGFGWNFNLGSSYAPVLQVIWVLGVSMITLAGLIWLPRSLIAFIAIAMIAGHNLLDGIQPASEQASIVWRLLHVRGLLTIGGTPLVYVIYPLIPWIGVMALGYVIGPYFVGSRHRRPRNLVLTGLAMTVTFVLLRYWNIYGDANLWQVQGSTEATIVDFLNATKYPPSLLFLLMTLGPAIMLLGLFERRAGALGDALVTIGRVPFFFYVAHLYVIHLIALVLGLFQGIPISQTAVVFVFYPQDFGVSLPLVYGFWICVVLAFYPACRWFAGVKARRRDWWLSYL